MATAAPEAGGGRQLPAALRSGFSDAMAQSLLLPAAVLLLGLIAALCFTRPAHMGPSRNEKMAAVDA